MCSLTFSLGCENALQTYDVYLRNKAQWFVENLVKKRRSNQIYLAIVTAGIDDYVFPILQTLFQVDTNDDLYDKIDVIVTRDDLIGLV